MNSKVYKWCAVPLCKNTTIKTPDKLFVYVSKKPERYKWLKLAGRDPTTLQEKTTVYFCEDHFDMPNDMENYMRYQLMGSSVSKVRMKPGCMPTKFECQQHLHEHMKETHHHQHLHDRRKQPNILAHKKRNMKENKECILRLKESDKVTVEAEFENTVSGRTVDHNLAENRQISLKNGKSNQAHTHTTRTKQSKANRTKVRLGNVTSVLKPRLKSAPTSPFKKKSRSEKRAPGLVGSSSALTPLPEPGYLDPLATEPVTPQCRFCAGFSKDCVVVTDKDRPYLTRNKTALTISDLSVELDFNDALPKTVCRACDSKLLDIFQFVKQVKEAQDSLINVRDYAIEIEVDTVVKNECETTPDENDDIYSKADIVDSLTVTDTVFVKPNKPVLKNKRKRVKGAKTHKKPKVTKDVESEEVEIIFDIKEQTAEFAEMVDTYETEKVAFDDTEMDTKPSELELQTLLKLMK